ncbi:MAG: hypothetical protein JW888_05570, partial [Pirellulales bacterium]|nr:hypothetical protein [Pirellulales bacterium]
GVVKPAIIVPSQLATEAKPKGIALVLAHEWAHIRNHDLWLLALGRVLLVLLFAHPVFWWLRRRIREDQEAVADAEVVGRASRTDYARELLDWARKIHTRPAMYTAALGIWERPSSLSRRIKMVLDETRRIHARCSRRWRCGALVLAGLLTLGVSLFTLQPATLADADPAGEPAAATIAEEVSEPDAAEPVDEKARPDGEPVWGTIVGPDGKPVEGVKVMPFIRPIEEETEDGWMANLVGYGAVRTDAAGVFRTSIAKQSEGYLQIIPKQYAPTAHRLPKRLGDLGRITLLEGLTLRGRVVDVDGKPLAGVCLVASADSSDVQMAKHEPASGDAMRLPVGSYGDISAPKPPMEQANGAWDGQPRFSVEAAVTGADGRFTTTRLSPGRYHIEFRGPRLDLEKDNDFARKPLPAALPSRTLVVDESSAEKPWEVRAVAHVVIEVENVDSSGKPFPGGCYWFVGIDGTNGGYTRMGSCGADGKLSLKVPVGTKQAHLSFPPSGGQDVVRWQRSKDSPVEYGNGVDLGTVDKDVMGIIVRHLKAPTLVVRAVGEDGRPIKDFTPSAVYPEGTISTPQPFQVGPADGVGDVCFMRGKEGYRSYYLLPDQEFTLTVEASGHEARSEKMTLAEGQTKQITWRLKNSRVRARTHQDGRTSADGKTNVAGTSVAEADAERRNTVRASTHPTNSTVTNYHGTVVDQTTGKPIEGATVVVERHARSAKGPQRLGKTQHRTDASGRYDFAVTIDAASRKNDYIVIRASHPDYLPSVVGGLPVATIEKLKTLNSPLPFERIALGVGEPVWGTVVGPDGKPVEGVGVRVMSYPCPEMAHDAVNVTSVEGEESGSGSLTLSGTVTLAGSGTSESPSPILTDRAGVFRAQVGRGHWAHLEFLPKEYAPFAREIHAERGDLGRFKLSKPITLAGRVLDAEGKPLAGVELSVISIPSPPEPSTGESGLTRVGRGTLVIDRKESKETPRESKETNEEGETLTLYSSVGFFSDTINHMVTTDEQGRYTMTRMAPGQYLIMLQMPYRPTGDGEYWSLPLPAAFLRQEVTLKEGESTKTLDIRAVPHVTIDARCVDSSGKPAKGVMLSVQGRKDGSDCFVIGRSDRDGQISVKMPKGMNDVILNLTAGSGPPTGTLRWRETKEGPLRSEQQTILGTLDRDMTELEIVSYRSPTVVVRATDEDGKPIPRLKARIRYPEGTLKIDPRMEPHRARMGDVPFMPSPKGTQRSIQLLPDQEFTLTVEAPGYEARSEKMTLSEGATKEIAWRLKKK